MRSISHIPSSDLAGNAKRTCRYNGKLGIGFLKSGSQFLISIENPRAYMIL